MFNYIIFFILYLKDFIIYSVDNVDILKRFYYNPILTITALWLFT